MKAIDLIAAERQRQIDKEGWPLEHDDGHRVDEMARAAAVYATPRDLREVPNFYTRPAPDNWPWNAEWYKPEPRWATDCQTPNDRIRELVKAGALIVAEIERLQRAEAKYK